MGIALAAPTARAACLRCHQHLRNPRSLERGYGPVCFRKALADLGDDGVLEQQRMCCLPLGASMDITFVRNPGVRQIGLDQEIIWTQPPYVATNVPWTVVYHSPNGFEWGYTGSGPADFALNILNLFVPPGADGRPPFVPSHGKGRCSATAFELHQEFKFQFIAPAPQEGSTIPGAVIREWLASKGYGARA